MIRTMLLVLATVLPAFADDAYFSLSIDELERSTELPSDSGSWRTLTVGGWSPSLVLDGPGESYLRGESGDGSPWSALRIYVAAPAGRDLSGTLYLPTADAFVAVPVRIAADQSSVEAESAFREARADHYRALASQGGEGAAWFRYRLRESQGSDRDLAPATRGRREVQESYEFLTGGRALAENLQLDRILEIDQIGEDVVELSTIAGVEVRPFDWTELVQGLEPEVDPLAHLIPIDQHAVLFDSFDAVDRLFDEGHRYGKLFAGLVEQGSSDSRVGQRYETQLCLTRGMLSRLFGDRLVASVAITGSDPYLRTGSDVAVLFEARDVEALETMIRLQIAASGASLVAGDVNGLQYRGATTPDRRVSAFVARVGSHLVVTNSLAQLAELRRVQIGETPRLTAAPEYTFFRDRYPRGSGDGVLVVLTDDTIRRWLSPRWRIAASRRIRAAALLADLQAQSLGELLSDGVHERQVHSGQGVAGGGVIQLRSSGVRSEVYGTLAFATPVRELDISRVSREEARAYQVFRDRYQRRWRVFDPIALKLELSDDSVNLDLTVIPLIDGTDYREIADVTAGVRLRPEDGDRHSDGWLHFIMALNPESATMQFLGGFVGGRSGRSMVNPLSWIGRYMEIYVDRDPEWEARVKTLRDSQLFQENEFFRVPIALSFDVDDPIRMAGFLALLRSQIEGSSPGSTTWEVRDHNGAQYVRIGVGNQLRREEPDWADLAIYYASVSKRWVISPREDVLKRALDRVAAKQDPEVALPGEPWRGESMGFQVSRVAMPILNHFFRDEFVREVQRRSWSNLPILNEWRRLYPEYDPVALHEELWQVRLVCPSGAAYVWNESDRTYESPVYGHPGRRKEAEAFLGLFEGLDRANFGLTFEHGGMRARMKLRKTR